MENDGKLFPGNNQFDRFSKIITRFRNNENLKDAFKFLGIDIQNIGSHSVRKGAVHGFVSPRIQNDSCCAKDPLLIVPVEVQMVQDMFL